MNLLDHSRRAKRLTVLLTLAVAASLVLLGAPADAARAPVKATVDDEWTPDYRHIEPGDRIIWKNPTEATHNVVAYGKAWSFDRWLYAGDNLAKRFPRKGVYKYRCSIHSTKQNGQCDGMCGVIHVAR